MKSPIEILSKSSSGDPYKVRFYIEETSVSAFCSCPAGEYRRLCKHVLRLLNGDGSILYDSNERPVLAEICARLESTSIPSLLSELSECEVLLVEAQKKAKKAKNELEKAILKK